MAAKPSVDVNIRRTKMGLKIKTYPLIIANKKQPYSKSAPAGNVVLCAGMDSIVDTVMMLNDLKIYSAMRETEAEFLQSHACRLVDDPPSSTFIKTASLATPECLVEIHATAVLLQDRPGWKVTKYPEWCAGVRAVIPYFAAGKPHLSKAVVVGDFIIGGGCAARTARGEATIGTTIKE
jgi:enamine deaminase RidA (YjgF/YER057c/UK114 family)